MTVSTGYILSSQGNFLLNHHLLRDATGKLWLFYLSPDRFLKYGTSDDGGKTWSSPSELAGEVTGPFTAAMDQSSGIHICTVKEFNNLLYLQWNGSNWSTNILPFDSQSGQPFFPMVHVNRWGIVHIICGFRIADNWSVIHYRIHPREYLIAKTHFDVPCASDIQLDINKDKEYSGKYVSFLCGAVDSDAECNLHLVHRYFDGRYFQLYYSFFNSENRQWEPILPLTDSTCNCSIPALFVDPQDNTHLLWSTSWASEYKLNYRQNLAGWQPQIILSENSEQKTSPILLSRKEELAICWHESGKIIYLPQKNDSNMNPVHLWTCPEDTHAIKINRHIWQAGSETVIPLTLARKENEHYLLCFATASLPEESPGTADSQSPVSNPYTYTQQTIDDNLNTCPEPGSTFLENQQVLSFELPGESTTEEPESGQDSLSVSYYASQQAKEDDIRTEQELIDETDSTEKDEPPVATAETNTITWKIGI